MPGGMQVLETLSVPARKEGGVANRFCMQVGIGAWPIGAWQIGVGGGCKECLQLLVNQRHWREGLCQPPALKTEPLGASGGT